MAINYDKLMKCDIPLVEQTFTQRDTLIYALGVGLGADPVDEQQLQFAYEKNLKALPTMAIILGYPGPWHATMDTGITRSHVVHGEQGFVIHKPLPTEGTVTGKTRLTAVLDKGADKGALLVTENEVRDKATGTLICTLTSTTFARKDGGFGGPSGPQKPTQEIPTRAPDHICDLATLPQAALLYRLSGDYNPLHGRATFSVAGHALLKTCCGYDPAKFKSMEGRFSSPVYPGEIIRTEMWIDGKAVIFRSTVPARGVKVLNNGRAEIT